jgi:hypothetical protein
MSDYYYPVVAVRPLLSGNIFTEPANEVRGQIHPFFAFTPGHYETTASAGCRCDDFIFAASRKGAEEQFYAVAVPLEQRRRTVYITIK